MNELKYSATDCQEVVCATFLIQTKPMKLGKSAEICWHRNTEGIPNKASLTCNFQIISFWSSVGSTHPFWSHVSFLKNKKQNPNRSEMWPLTIGELKRLWVYLLQCLSERHLSSVNPLLKVNSAFYKTETIQLVPCKLTPRLSWEDFTERWNTPWQHFMDTKYILLVSYKELNMNMNLIPKRFRSKNPHDW